MTGGSSGLGAAVVTAVAKAGGTAAVIDLAAPDDTSIPHVPADLSDSAAAAAAVGSLVDLVGPSGRRRDGGRHGRLRSARRRLHAGLGAGGARQPLRHGRRDASRPAAPRGEARTRRHRRVHARAQGGGRRDGVLRLEVRRRRVHAVRSRPSSRAGSVSRCSSPVACAPGSSTAAPSSTAPARTPRSTTRRTWPRRSLMALRQPPGLRGARARRGLVDGAVLAVTDVLALRALGLGDLLTCVPALRGLRRAWPDDRLVLAAPAAVGGWLASLGVVDDVRRGARPARRRRAARLPRCRRRQSRSTCTARGPAEPRRPAPGLQPGRLVAYACPEAGHLDGPSLAPRTSTRWTGGSGCRSGQVVGGRRGPPPPPAGRAVGPRRRAPRCGVRRRGAGPRRCWADVAAALAGRGHRVVVTGAPRRRAVRDGGARRTRRRGPAAGARPRRPGSARRHGSARDEWRHRDRAPRHGVRHALGDPLRPGVPGALGTPGRPPPAPRDLARRRRRPTPRRPARGRLDPRLASIDAGEVLDAASDVLAR